MFPNTENCIFAEFMYVWASFHCSYTDRFHEKTVKVYARSWQSLSQKSWLILKKKKIYHHSAASAHQRLFSTILNKVYHGICISPM